MQTRILAAIGGALVAAGAGWMHMLTPRYAYFDRFGTGALVTHGTLVERFPPERLLPVTLLALAAAMVWVLAAVLRTTAIIGLATGLSVLTGLILVAAWIPHAHNYGLEINEALGWGGHVEHDSWQMFRPTLWAILVLLGSLVASMSGCLALRRPPAEAASSPERRPQAN